MTEEIKGLVPPPPSDARRLKTETGPSLRHPSPGGKDIGKKAWAYLFRHHQTADSSDGGAGCKAFRPRCGRWREAVGGGFIDHDPTGGSDAARVPDLEQNGQSRELRETTIAGD